nr:MAG TPA: hypothetical protein [Caudoviricetes sp.]
MWSDHTTEHWRSFRYPCALSRIYFQYRRRTTTRWSTLPVCVNWYDWA